MGKARRKQVTGMTEEERIEYAIERVKELKRAKAKLLVGKLLIHALSTKPPASVILNADRRGATERYLEFLRRKRDEEKQQKNQTDELGEGSRNNK